MIDKTFFTDRYNPILEEFLNLYGIYAQFTMAALRFYVTYNKGDKLSTTAPESVIKYSDILEFDNCFSFHHSIEGWDYWNEWRNKYEAFKLLKEEYGEG